MSATAVDIGILGLGGFAMFAAQHFAQVPGAVLRCIAGNVTPKATSLRVVAPPPNLNTNGEPENREV
jgi:hypothetical protein